VQWVHFGNVNQPRACNHAVIMLQDGRVPWMGMRDNVYEMEVLQGKWNCKSLWNKDGKRVVDLERAE